MSDGDPHPYRPLASLAEAREASDGVVILEGDYGGQIYLVASAARVACDEAALARLLADLDAIAWPGSEPEASSVRYERLAAGERVPGGMGGGRVEEGVWIHAELAPQAAMIRAVLARERAAIGE